MNLWKLFNSVFIVFLIQIFGVKSNAQNSFQEYKSSYKDVNELILNNNQSYDIFIDDKKLRIIQDNHFESLILSENGILNNKESFTYSELVKLKNYNAYSIINENGREKKIKVTQSNEKQSKQNSIFFDDVRERQLIFSNLETGSKKVYDYQTEFMDPYLLHKFIFGGSVPIINSTLEIKTDKNINIGYKIFNDPTNSIVFSKTEKKGKWIYNWTLKDIKPLKYEDNMPGYLYTIPHINIYIKNYTIDNQNTEVLNDIDRLYEYYKGFVKNLNKTESPELKAKAIELTENKTNDTEKIKSIFYWVKENIKYIAFENGYEGFIPREASLIYERKFGDCKDMASIITAMAKYANIDGVKISWIGSRNIPYTYEQLATPAVDDHMIAVFKNNENYIFLDATDKETRFGIPTAFIQGKEALIYDGDKYKIITVPIVDAENNKIKENIKLSIENDVLKGKGNIEFNGYSRSHYLSQIGDATNKTRFEMIKSLVLKGNNKFKLENFTEENINDKDLPYIINYNFDIENYILKVNKDIYLNMFLDKPFENLTIEKDRVSKYDFDFLNNFNFNYELDIPSNFTLKYLPQNYSIDNELLKADINFKAVNNTIILTVEIKQKKLTLETSDFELWNQTIKKIKTNYTETLILTHK